MSYIPCWQAIIDLFKEESDILHVDEVVSRINKKYPRVWKSNTINAHLVGLSVNQPGAVNHQSIYKHAMLYWLGGARYRKWDPARDGHWGIRDNKIIRISMDRYTSSSSDLIKQPINGAITSNHFHDEKKYISRNPQVYRPQYSHRDTIAKDVWSPNNETLAQIETNKKRLIMEFDRNIFKFNQAIIKEETFSGPSLYFHYQCICKYHQEPVNVKINDNTFIEYIYAVLVSWGMHRMGKGATKLTDFHDFKNQIRAQIDNLTWLNRYKIWELTTYDKNIVIERINQSIESMRISKSKSHLVANTKVLHHILPNLIPPIDRSYSLAYFGIPIELPSYKSARSIFSIIYPLFIDISKTLTLRINRLVDLSKENWHTSFTKVIDNAIIGAMLP